MSLRTAFIDRLLADTDLLENLHPTGLNGAVAVRSIREAADDEITGGTPPTDPEMLALVRAALFYAHDAIDESHRIAQNGHGDAAAYLHAMIHRREGDFDNARYWYRRVGPLGFYDDLHRAASRISNDMAKQMNWDPYLFTGLCEQDKFGDREHRAELIQMQRDEFNAFFDYVFGKSMAA